jgi:hypothetical protein
MRLTTKESCSSGLQYNSQANSETVNKVRKTAGPFLTPLNPTLDVLKESFMTGSRKTTSYLDLYI